MSDNVQQAAQELYEALCKARDEINDVRYSLLCSYCSTDELGEPIIDTLPDDDGGARRLGSLLAQMDAALAKARGVEAAEKEI